MMELTGAFILISASLVIASPHGYGGYGVKGGASARAEASASSGAFGLGAVPVPLGVGYSGSFSKSSSSSSASSSASSSSSSSSFSYGGSGAGSFGLESGAPSHGGCSSGTCHTARNGVPTSFGSSPPGYNSANAAASAEAGAVSGLGCQGLSCGGNSDKCKSGECKPHTGTTSSNSDLNKCTSGQCGSSLDKGTLPTEYDSNDIRVSHSSGSAHNNNGQHSGIENSSSGYKPAGSDCSHGKCGPSGSSNSKLDYNHDFGNSYQGSGASNKQGSSANTGITSQYQKPSSHLETPKLDSECTSGNCNDGPAKFGHGNSPSSYNVPIHGAYEHGNPKPCDGVKCENQPKGPYSPTDDSVTKRPSSVDYSNTANCKGSGCYGTSANQAANQPSHTVSPSNIQFGHSPSNTPTESVTPAGINVAPGHVAHDKPSDDNKVSNDKLPAYTGGFGGPAGILKPNEYDFSAPPVNPNHGPTGIHSGKPLEGAPTGCNTPSCAGYPSAPSPTGGSVPEGTYTRPGDDISSGKLPSYTGGFGSTGMLNANEFNVHGTVVNKPNYAHTGSPLSNTQQPAGNSGLHGCKPGQYCGGYTPTAGQLPAGSTGSLGCKPGQNCGGYTPTAGQLPAVSTGSQGCKPGQYCGGYTPTAGQLPAGSTGAQGCKPGQNCDGYTPTAGQLPAGNSGSQGCKPGQYCFGNTPTVGQLPAGNTGSQGCKPGQNCGGYTPTVGLLPAGSTGAQGCKPGQNCDGYTPTVGQLPAGSTGSQGCKPGQNCGGYTPTAGQLPAGSTGAQGCILGQNCGGYTPIAGSAPGATAPSGYYGTTKPHSSTNSNNGLGGPAVFFSPGSGTGPSSPGYTPSETFNTPTSSGHPGDCKTPNCYSAFGSTAAPHAPAQPYGDTKPSSGSHLSSVPAYTNDYERPSGVQKPSGTSGPASTPSFTHTQSPSSPGDYSAGCKTGNCANYPSGQPGAFGVTKPNTNINTAPSQPQYSGGFGGPSGTFKPTEHTHVTPSTGSAPTNCGTPNCIGSPSASAGAASGANAQTGSYGTSKPTVENSPSNENTIYNGGFGGAAGLLKPNEYTIPAVSPKPINQHTGVPTTAACTSGHCDTQPPHSTAPHIDSTSSGSHATAAAAAVADAVVYTGGFGGPPGVLTPYDDGKIGALPTNGGQGHGQQIGGAHGSDKANINSPHGKIPVATGGPSGLSGVHENTGAQASSLTGATAYAGASAGASAGAHGYNLHGSHNSHEGNIKGGSPCGGGCGGSPSGATGKSLSGAHAFGVGGSFASSSASAHASAGAYTKGGYGKR
ncbi:hypothetical protein PYW08_007022 [Mythimna loreyi]|uniref:Uncharacterized protein n=1 Tax=Mythimna loreyi TaxID=667449 RepID=A0ACC2RB12_9NEOP|nr:hypothetical protein PYW08_007022 [Mythimna loreyi]